jgi:hypothetical protein
VCFEFSASGWLRTAEDPFIARGCRLRSVSPRQAGPIRPGHRTDLSPCSNSPTNGLNGEPNGEPDHVVVPDLPPAWRAFPAAEASVDGADVEPTVAPFGVLVSVVIPTLNEEKNLPYVLSGLLRGLHEVIILDGRSTDRHRRGCEAAAAGRPNIHAIGTGQGRCPGGGFRGMHRTHRRHARRGRLDGRGGDPGFVAALCNGADFVKGSSFAHGGASSDITRTRRWGNRALNTLVNRLLRNQLHGPLLRLQRLLGSMPPLHEGRLRGLRGRDARERQDRQGRLGDPRGPQLRGPADPRPEQPPCRSRRHEGAPHGRP